MKRNLTIILPVLLFALSGCAKNEDTTSLPWAKTEILRFHAIDLTRNLTQQDSYLIEAKDPGSARPSIVMIDVGQAKDMEQVGLPYLKMHGIKQIDKLYITHPHKDHYGGLEALLDSDITVKQLYMNIPLQASCDREIPWGCDYPHVLDVIEKAKAKGIDHSQLYVNDPTKPVTAVRRGLAQLNLLFAPESKHPDLGLVDINDHSMVFQLKIGDFTYLLPADLNDQGGEYLTKTLGDKLKADVLHAPHHAAEGAAPTAFLQAVNPSHAIVTSFTDLWCTKRSERMRTFFEKAGVQTRVLGVQGHVMVRHFHDTGPVWVEDRSKQVKCDEYWNSYFSKKATDSALPQNNQNILYALDSVQSVQIGDFPAIRLTGWTFMSSGVPDEIAPIVALLHTDTQSLHAYRPTMNERPDVTSTYKHMKRVPNKPGFELTLHSDSLQDGEYSVWFVYPHNERTITTKASKALFVKGGKVELR